MTDLSGYSSLFSPITAPFSALMGNTPAAPTVPASASPATTPAVPNVSTLSTNNPPNFTPATPAVPVVPTKSAAPAPSGNYTVASGDTLSGIAQKNGMTLQQLLAINPQYKTNPNLIKPGQSVALNGASPALPAAASSIQTTPSGVTVNGHTGGVVPTLAPATGPTAPAVPTLPPATNVNYSNYVNQNGTIFNTQTKKFFSSEDDLAKELGIDKSQIDWSKIGAAGTGFNAPDYQVAEKGVSDLMTPTADETGAQSQLDNLESSLSMGKVVTDNQPIPMEFITGQKKNIEDRTLALEQPLQQKLALLQAKRTAALGASQFTLTQMDKKIADAASAAKDKAAASKPTEVSNGGTLVDPSTGKVIYQAPYRSSSTSTPSNPFGSTYAPGTDSAVDAAIANIQAGNATLANYTFLTKGQRDLVSQGLAGGKPLAHIVDANTDAAVKAIISSNAAASDSQTDRYKAWDAAAKAINGIGTDKDLATKYDSYLKSVYEDGVNPSTLGTSSTIYNPLAERRLAMTANSITSNFQKLPIVEAVGQGQLYLPRIKAAAENPGSIGDAELLDSIVKLNTGGNAITDAQIQLITNYGSFKDKLSVLVNKFQKGGALSTDQRKQLVDIAKTTFDNYKKAYQPAYDAVTKNLTDAKIPKQFWGILDLNKLSSQTQSDTSSATGDADYQSYLKAINGQ